jgi:transglutaminase-like putative cysteine protease
MRLIPALLGLALFASQAAAQAPRVTPAGDPSVRNDTIYKLSVKPEDYPEEASILLLDDGVMVYNEDGTDTRTFRYVAQVLTQEAVETWAENSFSYDGSRQRFRLNWARVIGPDGRVISDKPSHDQESLAPVSESSPVYTDQKVRRISLAGVVPGVIVDYSYTIETVERVHPGDFLANWSVHAGTPVRRSRYVAEIPASLQPRIREENLNFQRKTRRVGNATVYEWATSEVPRIEGEQFMADSNDVFMSITMGGPVAWNDIAKWYHGLSHDRYEVTPAMAAKFAEIVKDARTRDDSLRALHRWVAQDFRYVSLSLGIGGYQPRTPASVMETQYGDCKDKATFFIALARRMGVAAHPVLLSSTGGVERGLPSINQFDHMIAAVEKPGGGYTFLDLTAELIPYGAVSPSYQGEFGLVVHPDGRGEEVTFPQDPPSANRSEHQIVGELSADGIFRGTVTNTVGGAMQYRLRSAFARRYSAKEKEDLGRGAAQGVFEGASADSLEIFDGRDLLAQPRTRLWVSGGRAATRSGETLILTLPLGNGSSSETIADLEAAPKPRRFPIDVASVVGPIESVSEFRVTLPEGYRARLPQNVSATSAFGTYTATYAQTGRELRVTKRMSGSRGTLPPTEAAALLAWLKEMGKDDVRFVVVEPAKAGE